MIKRLLTHPLAWGMDLDDPQSTMLRRHILSQKKFLREIYKEWYQFILENLPCMSTPVLELGSGAGFLHAAEAVGTGVLLRSNTKHS